MNTSDVTGADVTEDITYVPIVSGGAGGAGGAGTGGAGFGGFGGAGGVALSALDTKILGNAKVHATGGAGCAGGIRRRQGAGVATPATRPVIPNAIPATGGRCRSG